MQAKKLIAIMSAVLLFSSTTFAAEFETSTAEKPITIINLPSLEKEVRAKMEKSAFGYISAGAEGEQALRENSSSFDNIKLVPRVLKNIDSVDMTTTLLGIKLSSPIIQAPTAAHGLAHKQGEIGTAKGMIKAGSLYSLSTYGSKTPMQVAKEIKSAPFFFQFYMTENDDYNKFVLKNAKSANAKAIILTADAIVGGLRETNVTNNFKFPAPGLLTEYSQLQKQKAGARENIYGDAKKSLSPKDIQYIKNVTGLPVIIKGVMSAEDAEIAINAGAAAIWVSNHGGRQLDSAPATIDVLPEIAKAVNKRVPIIFDSGVRRGSHVFKALASGADIVALGRPLIYGLFLGGSEGVNSVMQHINKELEVNMYLAGTKNIEEVKKAKIIRK